MIVKVHNFLYPADFHVIKMSDNETAESSGVLLGRPFMRTAKTIIDVFDGTICLDYNGEKFTFSIDEAMRKPLDVENLHFVDVINPLVQEFLETELLQEQADTSEMTESMRKEVAGWCETVIKQGLSDEEITKAIMDLWQGRIHWVQGISPTGQCGKVARIGRASQERYGEELVAP